MSLVTALLLCAFALSVRAADTTPRCNGTALDPNIANRNYSCVGTQEKLRWSFTANSVIQGSNGISGALDEWAAWSCLWQVRSIFGCLERCDTIDRVN